MRYGSPFLTSRIVKFGAAKTLEINEVALSPLIGRFSPLLLTRLGFEGNLQLLQYTAWPMLCPKLSSGQDSVLLSTAGDQSTVRSLIQRGTALDPTVNLYVRSTTSRNAGDEVALVLEEMKRNGLTKALLQRKAQLLSSSRSKLNGLAINREQYTTFSRHFTCHDILRKIACVVQPLLQPGDCFVDFACGQHSFSPLLLDPATQQPLRSLAFDVIPPAERTDNFSLKSWFAVQVDQDLPSSELVIGLTPPSGHQNKQAIEFIEHALCARPRMLVLIMPTTKYHPEGYDEVYRDDSLCRGPVFYVPGGSSCHFINSFGGSPSVLVYVRKEPANAHRIGYCRHNTQFARSASQLKRNRDRVNYAERMEIDKRRKQLQLQTVQQFVCQPCV